MLILQETQTLINEISKNPQGIFSNLLTFSLIAYLFAIYTKERDNTISDLKARIKEFENHKKEEKRNISEVIYENSQLMKQVAKALEKK